MKTLLNTYETCSFIIMAGCLGLMLLALTEGAMDEAVIFISVSGVFLIVTAWTLSSTYLKWKERKGY